MPAVPRSATTKRTTQKPKGTTRAKSGCYTCRIRRKKCDEQSDETGSCRTCVRLRLECLGFGAKRPEWLRETRNVTEVREKIKNFLASHGMIKGHSGSGPTRSPECELLTLREGVYSDSSESSSTPTLSFANDTIRPHTVSSIREEPFWTSIMPLGYTQSNLYPSTPMRPDSPFSSQGSVPDQSVYQLAHVESSNSLVPSPATHSTFSALYHFVPQGDINMGYDDLDEDFPRNFTDYVSPEFVDEMVSHYMENVVYVQYLLVDKAIPAMIFQTVTSHEPSREAVKLLASVHYQRFRQPRQPALQGSEVLDRLASLNSLLSSADLVAEDAMAALHVISSILFDGGQGSWKQWLDVAYRYVLDLFRKYNSRVDEALMNCSMKDAFIIKTTIWFDVLASVTTMEVPFLLPAIRNLFSPHRSTIYDIGRPVPSQYSMLSPMGCENVVVWVLAETSALARWKRNQWNNGSLSVPDLVAKGVEIERYIPPPSTDVPSTDLQGRRLLASEIFRSASRLYLRSVVSGDYPQVPEIADSVKETVQCILRVKTSYDMMDNQQSAMGSIVRSTVFGFFTCGAFAEDEYSRHAVLDQLDRYGEGAGNCGSIKTLLKQLWDMRSQQQRRLHEPVPWRQLLKNTATLLV